VCQSQQYGSLRYVDSVEGNFLFRGPESLTPENTFDYPGLTDAIAAAKLPSNVPRPESFYSSPAGYFLVDINLLHPNETVKIAAGIDYFQANPMQGCIHLWDTNGTPLCYFNTAPAERNRLTRTLDQWLPDPLIWRVAMIRKWLEPSPQPTPVVIYVHCDGGCDRTAEIIGAYRLRYMQDSWATVSADQPCGRPLGCDNYRALQWYAFWLNTVMGFSITGIGEDNGCYDAGGAHKPCSPAVG
jgi:hypothetical protein